MLQGQLPERQQVQPPELLRLREQVRRLETENQELKRSKVTSIHQNARTR